MLELEAQLNQPCVGLGGTYTVYLGVTVRPSGATARMPVNVCVLLDVSSSMAGAKFAQALAAIRLVWRELAPDDTLTIVSFGNDTRVVLPTQRRGSARDATLETALAGLAPAGVTRLDRGLGAAVRALADVPSDQPRRIWLVTDGHPTNPRGTPLEDVSPLTTLAGSTAAKGISLGALGLGDAANFHVPFLTELADRGRGTFMYAPDPTDLGPLLREELQAATAIATLDAHLDLELKQGVSLLACERVIPEYRPHDLTPNGQRWRIAVGDFPRPESTYILELRVYVPMGQQPGKSVIGRVLADGHALGQGVATAPTELVIEHTRKASRSFSIRNDRIENLRINLMLQRNMELRGKTSDPHEKLRLTTDALDAARRTGNLPLADELEAQRKLLLAGGALTADAEARTTKDARISGKLPQFSATRAGS